MDRLLDAAADRARQDGHSLGIDDQRVCLWLVPVFGALLLIAFAIFPGFVPPLTPTMSADEVAEFYRSHVAQVRLSMILFNLCGIMFIPFFSLVVVQMQRMALPTRAFAYSYLGAVVSGATMFALADLAWLMAAFRPERDPQQLQLLNDLGWMAFVTPVGFVIAQNVCLALAIYMDEQARPVFARWVGHFNLAIAALMTPGAFALMHKTGPLAWDGVLAYWVRNGAYVSYIVVMFFAVRSALDAQAEARA